MQILANTMEGDSVNGIHFNERLSTFLKSMKFTQKSTASIHQSAAIKLFWFLNHRTYNLPLSENWLPNLHSVSKVKPE